MPLTVVGRPAKFYGKTFFEIACNLKNFGVGRVVVRNAFLRYKEPTYYRVVRVEPAMDEEFKMGKAWVETVWRGRNLGVLELFSAYKSDFNLILKEEEEAFCNKNAELLPLRIMPRYTTFPPLLRAKIMEEMAAKGETVTEPKLELVYVKNPCNRNRVAEEGEAPTIEFYKHVSWHLYNDIIDKRKQTGNKDLDF